MACTKEIKDFNDSDLISALNQIMVSVKIDVDHDIPYLAGYSIDGQTIYIDRGIPLVAMIDGKKCFIFRALIIHEAVEKAVMDRYNMIYMLAHQIALRVEENLITAMGIDWVAYEDFLAPYIKRAEKEKLTNIPADLDLKPYVDEAEITIIKEIMVGANEQK